jgi:hypothetical protein
MASKIINEEEKIILTKMNNMYRVAISVWGRNYIVY